MLLRVRRAQVLREAQEKAAREAEYERALEEAAWRLEWGGP